MNSKRADHGIEDEVQGFDSSGQNGQFIGTFPNWVAVPDHEGRLIGWVAVPAGQQISKNRDDPNGYHPPLH
jgi:hypothetical protein